MTTAAVFEYSPALLAKIHPLFSLWPLVLLSFKMNREKKHIFLIHPQMSRVLPPFNTQAVHLPHLAETQRAMYSENHNHLAVGFHDSLQPHWWMSQRIRKMTDVIWINYSTLYKKIYTPPHISETSVICCQKEWREWLSSFWVSFLINWHKGEPAVSWQERGRGGGMDGGWREGARVRFKSHTDSDLIEISEVNSNDEV